jgi:hypothetical protein
MLKQQVDTLIEKELIGRWPEWTPTEAQIRDARDWFSGFEYDFVVDEIKKHREDSNLKCPNIGKIYRVCKNGKKGVAVTQTPCYAVFDSGYIHTVVIYSGQTENEGQIEARARIWFCNPYFESRGNYTLFIGESNMRAAQKLSFEKNGLIEAVK